VVVGLLRALGAALQRHPKWKPGVQPVVRMVLEQYLFELPDMGHALPYAPPVAKLRATRNACYDAVIEMVSTQAPRPCLSKPPGGWGRKFMCQVQTGSEVREQRLRTILSPNKTRMNYGW